MHSDCSGNSGSIRHSAAQASASAVIQADRAAVPPARTATAVRAPTSSPRRGRRSHGRARPTRTRTSGYSQTESKITGATRAVKAPPTTPPTDSSR